MMKRNVAIILIPVVLTVSACSTVNNFLDSKVSVDYGNNASVKALEIPPDLTSPQFDDAFALPAGGTVSAAAMQGGDAYTPPSALSANTSPVVTPRTGKLSSVRSQADETVLQIHDTYQRALVLTDIILQRMGFAVLSANPKKGLLRVEYNGKDISLNEKKNFLSRMFKRSSTNALSKGKTYQVQINEEGGVPLVRFKDANGKPLKPQSQKRIIKLMDEEFNR
jgi:uncharacterized lipoprotein